MIKNRAVREQIGAHAVDFSAAEFVEFIILEILSRINGHIVGRAGIAHEAKPNIGEESGQGAEATVGMSER